MVVHSSRSSAGVLGGKNSKENVGWPVAKQSLTERGMSASVMSATVPAHDAPLGEPIGTEPALVSRIDTELGSFLDDRLRSLLDLHVDLTPLAELARAAVLD